MDDDVTYAELSRRLREGHARGGLAPVSPDIPDLAGAYRVQSLNTAFWEAAGRQRTGYKIGMTSAAAQRQFGVTEPDSGILFAENRIANGGTVPRNRTLEPRIEGEIALVIGRDMSEPLAPDAIAASISGMAPAIEIADSRIGKWAITIRDTVADNASAGLYVLGDIRPFAGEDLAGATMALRCAGEIVSCGTGAATMAGPLHALAWLARQLNTQGGRLRAGDIVLTGALGAPDAVKHGAHYQVEITGLGSASVTFG